MILRLPIQVKLFNGKGELVETINSSKKSQVRLRVHDFPRANWTFGTCRIWYNKSEDFWNEFIFLTPTQLHEGLTTDSEQELIAYLRGIIPGNFLEKRQLSAAQLRAVAKARRNSSLEHRKARSKKGQTV